MVGLSSSWAHHVTDRQADERQESNGGDPHELELGGHRHFMVWRSRGDPPAGHFLGNSREDTSGDSAAAVPVVACIEFEVDNRGDSPVATSEEFLKMIKNRRI